MRKDLKLLAGCLLLFYLAYSLLMGREEPHSEALENMARGWHPGEEEVEEEAAAAEEARKTREEPPAARGSQQTLLVTTECLDGYQEWQQAVVVNSARLLRQEFRVLRLVACDEPAAKMSAANRGLSDYAVTPVFSTTPRGIFAPTLNKPGALHHWLSEGEGASLPDEHELVLTDPDFVFTAPLPYQQSSVGVMRAGFFNMGTEFMSDERLRKYCGGFCDHWTQDYINSHGFGPPYVIRKVDAVPLFAEWYRLTAQIVDETGDPSKAWEWSGHWFVDMWALLFAVEKQKARAGLRLRIDGASWLVNHDYGLWERVAAEKKRITDVWALHYFTEYTVTDKKYPGLTLKQSAQFKGKFKKHDWRAEGADLALQCDPEKQLLMWKKYGWNMHPAVLAPEPPVEGLVPESASRLAHGDLFGQRNLYVWWQLYHRINAALALWREEHCSK